MAYRKNATFCKTVDNSLLLLITSLGKDSDFCVILAYGT